MLFLCNAVKNVGLESAPLAKGPSPHVTAELTLWVHCENPAEVKLEG